MLAGKAEPLSGKNESINNYTRDPAREMSGRSPSDTLVERVRMGQSSQPHELGGGLKSRHVTMLSIAGVIRRKSVCRFPASPSPKRARRFTGLSVRRATGGYDYADVGGNGGCHADTGSFSTYADKAIGRWAGYTIGWLYWWFWVTGYPAGSQHRAMIPASWVPGIPIWLFSLVITLALTGSNLLSVKNYGEFEFWLALCKVIAILAFIFLGAVAISGFYRMPK